MTEKDLLIELQKSRLVLGNMQILVRTGQDKASHKVGKCKREIAQIQTLLSQSKTNT